jgi:hypothetical protein
LKPVLLNSAPLSILIPVAAVYALVSPTTGDSISLHDKRGDAVRLFAIFYFATVIFFSIAAYKRRSYLLPVWPAASVILAWSILTIPPRRWRRAATWSFAALCAGLVVFNFIDIPRAEVADCRDDSFRPAAEEIARVVAPADPLYLYGFREEVAPLLFYLDRDAPIIDGRLGDAPPGFIILPASAWKAHQGEALDFEPVLTSDHGSRHLVLIKRGKSYAVAHN